MISSDDIFQLLNVVKPLDNDDFVGQSFDNDDICPINNNNNDNDHISPIDDNNVGQPVKDQPVNVNVEDVASKMDSPAAGLSGGIDSLKETFPVVYHLYLANKTYRLVGL